MSNPIEEKYERLEKNTLENEVLSDALDMGESYEEQYAYIKDVVTHGCAFGACPSLTYYEDTHKFYNKHAEEIDEIVHKLGINVSESMQELGQHHAHNFLAWLGYEHAAQKLLEELPANE